MKSQWKLEGVETAGVDSFSGKFGPKVPREPVVSKMGAFWMLT